MLYDVAQGRAAMSDFLGRFGHRAAGEMELSQPRWREDPDYLEQMLPRLRSGGRDPRKVHDETVARRRAAEAELPKLLERSGGSCLREQVKRDLADARDLLPYRESGKHYLMMGYELLRLCTEELARRWDLGGRLYFLRLGELNEYPRDRGRLDEEIACRRTRWQAMQRLDAPDVIDSRDLDRLGLAPQLDSADDLNGSAVASGVASGTVRVVFDPQQAGDLGADYVLVCPSTDPGWTPLFLNARALVVERGGVLSHGAIVARDFGIPAVVCPNATKLLKDGDRVRVDGNAGRVSVLAREAAHA
jgi:pyruvate,water dikinase